MKLKEGQNSRQARTVNFGGQARNVIVSTTMTHMMVFERLDNGSTGKLLADSAVKNRDDFDFDMLLSAACGGKNQSFFGDSENKKRMGKAASRGKQV